jgi:outer membrane receptor protein involved in Fe transport
VGEDGKVETGFELELDHGDMDFRGEYLENAVWIPDSEKTNRFVFDQNIYALYATYETKFGKLGVIGGVRGEYSDIKMKQITQGTVTPNNYINLFPTLHTAYSINDNNELQFNYSLRINRPESDDLNPFPEYQDPLNLRAGNPHLKPEKIHSVEAGYMFRENATTITATAYYRYFFNQMTSVTHFLNDSVMLTTKENLSSSQSSGFEFIVNSKIGKIVTYNFSSNVFYNVIDASGLGYSNNKSAIAWNAALNANFNINSDLMAQLNTRYTPQSLTPQGYREPSYIMNLGARYDIFKRKASLMFMVSDLFNSFRQINTIDTPELKQRVERKRTSQIFYVGFVYRFGKTPKRPKEEQLKYDEGI